MVPRGKWTPQMVSRMKLGGGTLAHATLELQTYTSLSWVWTLHHHATCIEHKLFSYVSYMVQSPLNHLCLPSLEHNKEP